MNVSKWRIRRVEFGENVNGKPKVYKGATHVMDTLTAREREVHAMLVGTDASAKEIAYRLGISVGAVNHVTVRLYRKLGAHSRVELIMREQRTAA